MKVQIKSLNSVCDLSKSAGEFTRFNMDAILFVLCIIIVIIIIVMVV